MKVKSIKKIQLDKPMPVYDITSPKYHNFVLGNGCVVHNTAKRARYNKFQAVLPLKGKIMNVMKEAKQDRIFSSEEVIGVLRAIGYNPSNKQPLDKLRIGKLILLSDPDPDGPLDGKTRILTLDGRNPTIRELANEWEENQKPVWIYSRDRNGKLIPAQAIKAHHAVTVDELVRITFDDGTIIKCSLDHKWKSNLAKDKRHVTYKGQKYLRAQDLQVGDSINSVYLEERNSDGNRGSRYLTIRRDASCSKFISVCREALLLGKLNSSTYTKVREKHGVRGDPKRDTGLSLTGVSESKITDFVENYRTNHTVTKVERIRLKNPCKMYCMSVPETGNFMVADKNGNGICSGNCHINVLLLTLIARFLPGMFDRGLVYVVAAPKYVLKYKEKNYFSNSVEGMRKVAPKGAPLQNMSYIKGWGEINAEALREIAFDVGTRQLLRITGPSRKDMLEFTKLMSDNVDYRRELLGI